MLIHVKLLGFVLGWSVLRQTLMCSSKPLFSPNYKVLIVSNKIKENPWYIWFTSQSPPVSKVLFTVALLTKIRHTFGCDVSSHCSLCPWRVDVCMCIHVSVHMCMLYMYVLARAYLWECAEARGGCWASCSLSTMSSWDGVSPWTWNFLFFWLGQLANRPQWSSFLSPPYSQC